MRQSADAGYALCSWEAARTVLTGTAQWSDPSHTALVSQQGCDGVREQMSEQGPFAASLKYNVFPE